MFHVSNFQAEKEINCFCLASPTHRRHCQDISWEWRSGVSGTTARSLHIACDRLQPSRIFPYEFKFCCQRRQDDS